MWHKPHFKCPGTTNMAGILNNISSENQTWKEMFLLENFCKFVFLKLINNLTCFNVWASLVAQIVKNLCNVGDPGLISGFGRSQKGMATHSSNLVYRISWTVKPGGLQFMGSLYFMESDNWVTNIFITKIQIIFKSIKPRTIFEKKIQVLQIQGKWR